VDWWKVTSFVVEEYRRKMDFLRKGMEVHVGREDEMKDFSSSKELYGIV